MYRSPAQNRLIRCRYLVENLWARLKEWRAVATSFFAVIHIAAAADWIKPEQDLIALLNKYLLAVYKI